MTSQSCPCPSRLIVSWEWNIWNHCICAFHSSGQQLVVSRTMCRLLLVFRCVAPVPLMQDLSESPGHRCRLEIEGIDPQATNRLHCPTRLSGLQLPVVGGLCRCWPLCWYRLQGLDEGTLGRSTPKGHELQGVTAQATPQIANVYGQVSLDQSQQPLGHH